MNFAFAIVLVLTTTNLFSFLAAADGMDVGTATAILAVSQCGYIAARGRVLRPMMAQSDLRWWVVLLAVWPIATAAYSLAPTARAIGLQAYYASLLVSAVAFAASAGRVAVHRTVGASMLITAAGVALSFLAPQVFVTVARATDSLSEYSGRAYGFQLQPNAAALAMNFLFLAWYSTKPNFRSTLADVLAFALLLGVCGATASRLGVMASLLILAMILFHARQRRVVASGKLQMRVLLLVLGLGATAFVLRHMIADSPRANDLMRRLSYFASGKIAERVGTDVSIQGRMAAQRYYLARAQENPLFGHGIGAETNFVERRLCAVSSHSTAVSLALDYGVLYPLAVVLLMVRLHLAYLRTQSRFVLNPVLQFCVLVAAYFVLEGGLFYARAFYLPAAVFLASVYSVVADGSAVRSRSTRRWTIGRQASAA